MESILSEHDSGENDALMDFDTLFDTKALRIMRVLIPFLPAPYQPLLAVWLRFSQLQYAISLLNGRQSRTDMGHQTGMIGPNASREQTISHILRALKPCLSESEYQELCRIQNMFSMYQRFQQLAPYLSALNGMSGESSAADIMSAFSAMQGGDSSMADVMSAFSAMQGGDSSAADVMSAFSAMQGGNNSAADAMSAFSSMQGERHSEPEDHFKQDASPEMNAASVTPATADSSESAKPAYSNDTDSTENQTTGSGMDLSRILDLISIFQASSDETDAKADTTERQDNTIHE